MKTITYKEIRAEYRRLYGKPIIQNCQIADIKLKLGFSMHYSYNRKDKNSSQGYEKHNSKAKELPIIKFTLLRYNIE